MSWIRPPQHAWSLDEIKQGNLVATYSLNDVIQSHSDDDHRGVTFGRIADDPSLVDIVTAHESCSRRHARIAFDRVGTPWMRDLGSGNGTFVNERRLPPEACGKEEDVSGSGARKGSRGVVLYPGDAIRFGASTRVFILEGPEEFERSALELKRRMNASAAVDANHSKVTTPTFDEEATPPVPVANSDVGCSWGMAEDLPGADQKQQVRDDDGRSPLPSIDSFFFSQTPDKCKIPDALHKLHSQYNTKFNKLQSIQLESQRILHKENMGVELSDGQRGQLAKNGERIATLENEVANLKDKIEDGMFKIIHGKDRCSKRPTGKDQHYAIDDDVDEFFDRTAKKQRNDGDGAESEGSLIQKWKTLLEVHAKQQIAVTRAQERSARLQKQIDDSATDDDDAFFIQNDLALANDNLDKATKCVEATAEKLDDVEYLVKIVNAKIVWDREKGLIGTNIKRKEEISVLGIADQDTIQSDMNVSEDDSKLMPPPSRPMAQLAPSSERGGEITKDVTYDDSLSINIKELQSKTRVIGPMRPPPRPEDNNDLSMPPINKQDNTSYEPTRKKIQLEPVHGTLALLYQAAAQPKASKNLSFKKSSPCTSTGHDDTNNRPKMASSDPFVTKNDEWKAPVGQDGSGRTALHDKFKGRY